MKMKTIFLIIGCVLAAILIFYFALNAITEISIEKRVRADTGLQLDIKSFNISPIRSLVRINDFRLFNPEGYQDKVMIYIPEILIDYNLLAALKGRIHVEELFVYLKELTVVKNKYNEVNLKHLEVTQKQQEKEEGDPSKVQIDKLNIKIEKVIYKDYSNGKTPSVTKFNIDDVESYEEVKNSHNILEFVITSALAQSDVGYLADYDLIPFVRGMHPSCRGPTLIAIKIINKTIGFSKSLCNTAEHALKRNANRIKNYFCPKKEK